MHAPLPSAFPALNRRHTPGIFRSYVTTMEGIISFLSSTPPWTYWQPEAGYRLQVDASTGLENCKVGFPAVIQLAPGRYMMIYESVMPGCSCDELHPACE